MAEKVTEMVLKVVDLQCSCCYKKIKKLLCKFPEIRDQKYDEKQNQVIITVVCCSPEKLRDKLCCKGWKLIKSIEIKEPPKPKPDKKLQDTDESKPPNGTQKTNPGLPQSKKTEKQGKKDEDSKPSCCRPCSEGSVGGPCYHGCGRPTLPPPPPPPQLLPLPTCCGPCSEGYARGPCYHGYGSSILLLPPPPPQPCYDGYGYGYGGGNKRRYVSRCDYYFSEENTQGCTIM